MRSKARKKRQRGYRMTARRMSQELQALLSIAKSEWQRHLKQLARKNGGELSGIVKSALPQPTRPKTSPIFKQAVNPVTTTDSLNNADWWTRLAEGNVHCQVIHGEQTKVFVKLSCTDGNALGFTDYLYWSPKGNYWHNDESLRNKELNK